METIATDSPLNESQIETLRTLVGVMIPASERHGVPGADDPIILADIVGAVRSDAETVIEGLNLLGEVAHSEFGSSVSALTGEQVRELAIAVEEKSPRLIQGLVSLTVQCYYRDSRVMESLGMEARPPFPQGFEVAEGDWSMLDPVRARGPIWRKT